MMLDADESVLVLVDYQQRLMPAIFDGAAVLDNAVRLLRLAALFGVPACLTEQIPAKLGATVAPVQAAAQAASARMLSKTRFGAGQEGLVDWLRPPARPPAGNARSLPKHLQKPAREPQRGSVVLAGCEAHVCLLQTALELLEDEFEVWVVADACSSRTERNRDAAFDRLVSAGAELVTTEMVAFEWLRTAEHPQFKQVQALIR